MDFNKIIQELEKNISKEKIFLNEPMKNHTTFKIGGNADVFIKAKNIIDVMHTLKVASDNNIQVTIIGNGSNILVKDKGIRGIVLQIQTENFEIIKDKENVYVVVDSGMANGKLSGILAKNSISGFEFAAGIPGSIGGAIRMNAGAYGGEFKDIVEETVYLDLKDNKIKVLSNEQHNFSYRNSIFSNKESYIINTKLKLNYGNTEEIKKNINENLKSRKEKQPLEYPSAGSTFKRGEDFISAKLIDECGLKGTTIGDAQVSEKHAGFIINKGNAKADDVLKLIELVRKTVLEKTGKELKLEIEVIGE